MKKPKLVHEEYDGFVMEWPNDGTDFERQHRFTAFEYSFKPRQSSGILLADLFKGGYPTLEEAKKNILCQKKNSQPKGLTE